MAVASLLLGTASPCLSIVAGVPGVVCGVLALRRFAACPGALRGGEIAIVGIVASVFGAVLVPIFVTPVALVWPAMNAARDAARTSESQAHLKQIVLALYTYHDEHGVAPPAGGGRSGLPLSWRVRLLPYLDQKALYDRFRPQEPWDSPHNKALLKEMPEVYRNAHYPRDDFKTVYLAVVGVAPEEVTARGDSDVDLGLGPLWNITPARTFFHRGAAPVAFEAVSDGLDNTVMVVEVDADRAVEWTAPDDWELDLRRPRNGLGRLRPGGFHAVFVDGRMRTIDASVDDETLRRMFVIDDGMPVNF